MKYKRQAYSVKRIEALNPETHKLFAKRYSLNAGSRGFTLLLAALISSVVLALGVSIFEIARKQVNLSSIGRESQFAFYAADTGAECALYWDVRSGYFAVTAPEGVVPQCAEQPFSGLTGRPPSDPADYTIAFKFEPVAGRCAQVKVRKCDPECDDLQNIRTVIHADGYNTGCESINTSSRVLQRSVELHY
ncbi:MAG: hypothetical protein Q7S01_02525 [bacterium]|nr:hypothetical protein [bacterium]